jgi:hypothetical protein
MRRRCSFILVHDFLCMSDTNCCEKCAAYDFVESELNKTHFCGNIDCPCHSKNTATKCIHGHTEEEIKFYGCETNPAYHGATVATPSLQELKESLVRQYVEEVDGNELGALDWLRSAFDKIEKQTEKECYSTQEHLMVASYEKGNRAEREAILAALPTKAKVTAHSELDQSVADLVAPFVNDALRELRQFIQSRSQH